MRKAWLVVAVMAVLASACAARNKDEGAVVAEEDGTTSTTVAEDPVEGGSFGDLDSPCGEGDYSVEASEAAGSTDTLRIGVANDRTSQIRPGLNKEMWDASEAFAAWCNEQGGIGGVPIELVDIDGKLLEVESAMSTACNGVFMMVGGGHVQDNLQFTGRPESDFHQCGLADIPGIAVAPQKTDSNGQVQPIPHPASRISSSWVRDFGELHPEQAQSMAEVWGTLPALEAIRNQTEAILDAEGVEMAGDFSYPPTGLPDWTPLAQQVLRSGATSMHFVGEPTNLGALVKSLREQGWEGTPIVETNAYDDVYVESAGVANAAGTLVRSVFHPFEEARLWPAVQQYVDIVEENVEEPKIALLGMQSFSAWLLFATAADACGEADGVLTRACVLEAAADTEDWTAGGLHAPTDPGPEGGTPGQCEMLLEVTEDGDFERAWPEIGSEADAGDGFTCYEDSIVEVPSNEGLGTIGPDQPL